MKIILSGGGTGGHIYPALAIASEIKHRVPEAEILYVGTARGMESKIVPNSGLKFKTVDISGIDRSSMLKAGKSVIKFPTSFFQAHSIIKEFQPDVIVGTGGYVSFPIVLAGTFFGVKTVIHEQNAIPGLANRGLAKRVDKILLTFEEANQGLSGQNSIVTGLPVRKQIIDVDREIAFKNLGFDKDIFTLLVFGGSLGAQSINRAMLDFIERSKDEAIQIIWITGQGDYEKMNKELNNKLDLKKLRCQLSMLPYMYNMEEALAVADLAVCRAGASTVCELEVLGLPAILIPYPFAADNHQEKNAQALVDKNAAFMVIDEFLDGYTLYKKVHELRNDPEQLKQMGQNMLKEARPNALKEIVDEIFSLVNS